MAAVGNKRPKAAAVKQASIEGTSAFLESLPEKPKEDLSLREAIDQMRDSVRSALSKGYTYQELAAMLTEKGIKISAFTLKNYVPSGRRRSSKEQQAPEKVITRRPRKAKEDAFEAGLDVDDAKAESTSAKNDSNGAISKVEEAEKAPAKTTRGQSTAAKAKTAGESTVKQTAAKRTRSSATKATKDTKPTAPKSRRKS